MCRKNLHSDPHHSEARACLDDKRFHEKFYAALRSSENTQLKAGKDWEWMIFHLLAAAPLALCSPVAKAATNPWLRGWSRCLRGVCRSRLAGRAGGEQQHPKPGRVGTREQVAQVG